MCVHAGAPTHATPRRQLLRTQSLVPGCRPPHGTPVLRPGTPSPAPPWGGDTRQARRRPVHPGVPPGTASLRVLGRSPSGRPPTPDAGRGRRMPGRRWLRARRLCQGTSSPAPEVLGTRNPWGSQALAGAGAQLSPALGAGGGGGQELPGCVPGVAQGDMARGHLSSGEPFLCQGTRGATGVGWHREHGASKQGWRDQEAEEDMAGAECVAARRRGSR